jgi:DnaJ-class molecular chaperone
MGQGIIQMTHCPICKDTGAVNFQGQPETCPICEGDEIIVTLKENDPEIPAGFILCPACGGSGVIEGIIGYATHEMTMDAGDLDYEGYPILGEMQCPACSGDGLIEKENENG